MKPTSQSFYLLLLVNMWAMGNDDIELSQCSIRNDDRYIASVLGIRNSTWVSIRADIMHEEEPLLKVEGDYLVSETSRENARKYRHYKHMKSEAGKASAESRYNKDEPESVTPVEQKGNGVDVVFNSPTPTPTPTPTSIPKKKSKVHVRVPEEQARKVYDELRSLYPRSIVRDTGAKPTRLVNVTEDEGYERFRKHIKTPADLEIVVPGLRNYLADGICERSTMLFSTFLNQAVWRRYVEATPAPDTTTEIVLTPAEKLAREAASLWARFAKAIGEVGWWEIKRADWIAEYGEQVDGKRFADMGCDEMYDFNSVLIKRHLKGLGSSCSMDAAFEDDDAAIEAKRRERQREARTIANG